MKTLILILFLTIPVITPAQELNFLVTIKTGSKTQVFKNASTAKTDSLLLAATGITTGIKPLINNAPFFEVRTRQTWFYCEIKKTTHRRKLSPCSQGDERSGGGLVNNH